MFVERQIVGKAALLTPAYERDYRHAGSACCSAFGFVSCLSLLIVSTICVCACACVHVCVCVCLRVIVCRFDYMMRVRCFHSCAKAVMTPGVLNSAHRLWGHWPCALLSPKTELALFLFRGDCDTKDLHI